MGTARLPKIPAPLSTGEWFRLAGMKEPGLPSSSPNQLTGDRADERMVEQAHVTAEQVVADAATFAKQVQKVEEVE
jgi:hypothetical protein